MKKFFMAAAFSFSGSLFFPGALLADVYIVETYESLSQGEINKVKNIEGVSSIKRFLPFGDGYLQRLYEVELQSEKSLHLLGKVKLVKMIEADHEAELFEIKPNKKSEMFSEDMLYPFQWGLQNQEQIISAQTPNGGPEETKGAPGQDVDWKEEIEKIEKNLRKDPVVAVIDMGIDSDHPELKEQLYKNEIECDQGSPQTGKREDRDKNGLPGDCHGWNFASTSYLYDAHPTDDKGHGTHVAGIIAAKRNNKTGVAGVSDKIKILPVRVTGRVDETEDRKNLKYRAASRRIAKGIFYAVHRKVDVINLSLGWPKSMNTNYMRMAVKAALQNNVLVVAAAGNNNSRANIYPCAYREVVCVGSIDADGKVSRFSNYGGEVDILAPGDQIVSTIPTQFIPLKLNLQGYDIMSGTSQAAPFVSAAAALIKSVFPGLPNDEVKRKLFDSAKQRPDDFKSMHGLLQIKKAFALPFESSVKPVFKQMSEAVYDPQTNKFQNFVLNIKNFGKPAENVEIKARSLTKGIEFEKELFELGSLRAGEITSIELPGRVLDKMASSRFRFEIAVYIDGEKKGFYLHETSAAKELYQTIDKEIMPFQFANEDKKPVLISFRREFDEKTENKINQNDRPTRSNLRTVEELYPSGNPSYYLILSDSENEKRKEIFFFDYIDGKIVEKKKSLVLEDAIKVESVQKLDYNYDGIDDYLVKSVKVVDNEKIDIQHRYLDRDLNPLYPSAPIIHYFYSRGSVAVTPKTVRHVKTVMQNGDLLASPVFVAEGGLAPDDQIHDPWSRKDQSSMRRIYRLDLVEGKTPEYRY
ncbi:MAG: S8 family serine peptidase, partial [Bacteriovoracaceae bacterium]